MFVVPIDSRDVVVEFTFDTTQWDAAVEEVMRQFEKWRPMYEQKVETESDG